MLTMPSPKIGKRLFLKMLDVPYQEEICGRRTGKLHKKNEVSVGNKIAV